jgi:hypothetical protein
MDGDLSEVIFESDAKLSLLQNSVFSLRPCPSSSAMLEPSHPDLRKIGASLERL